MKQTLKNLLLGALFATAIGGAFTASAKPAHAASGCPTCDDGFVSGYMVASGLEEEMICVAADDPRAEHCSADNS